MSRSTVNAWIRHETGKGPARRMRAEGKIPAVLYGGGGDPVSLSLDPRMLVKALDPTLKRNTLVKLEIEGNDKASCLVMVKDAQVDPLRDQLIHVDLIRVGEDQLVDVQVPLVLTGRAEGVKLGGLLQQVFRLLPIRTKASQIPAKVEVDTTLWEMHDQFRVADLPLPDHVTILLDPKQTVASVVPGRAVEEEEEVAVEGEGEGEGEGEEAAAEGGDSAASESKPEKASPRRK